MNKLAERNKNSHSKYNLYADLGHVKEAVFDATEHAKRRASKLIAQSVKDAKIKTNDIKDHIEDYVTEKPFKALGIAALTGLLLGYLLRRK